MVKLSEMLGQDSYDSVFYVRVYKAFHVMVKLSEMLGQDLYGL